MCELRSSSEYWLNNWMSDDSVALTEKGTHEHSAFAITAMRKSQKRNFQIEQTAKNTLYDQRYPS
jgi:hypothetical protein